MLFCNVVGTLHCHVVILGCGNVAGLSFSQRCENNLLTTLYNVVFTLCVCWVPLFNPIKHPLNISFGIL